MEILAAFSKQRGITFPLLSDQGSQTIKRYGILNPFVEQAFGPNRDDAAVRADIAKYVSAVGPRPEMAGIALPGTFVIDRRGRVTARFFEDFYIDRNTVSSLLIKLGVKADAAVRATKIATNQLDLITYPSDSAVAPGNHFSLAVEVEPHPHMHVYAPGAEAKGYRVISLSMQANEQVHVLPLKYPASEIYYFKALNERVPVFQKPFQLVQELVLDGTPASQEALRGKQELALKGTLQYQACDDGICYNPVTVPLSWNLSLRNIIREPR